MTRTKKIRSFARLFILYSSIALVVFTLVATFIFFYQKSRLFKQAEEQFNKTVKALILSVKIDKKIILEKNQIANNVLKIFIIENKNNFGFNGRTIELTTLNYQTNLQEKVKLKSWTFKGDTILNNAFFLKSLSLSSKNDLFLAQKTTRGYVVVSSTNPEWDLLLFPISSRISYLIGNGENYSSTLNFNGKNFYITASPLYKQGQIVGFFASISEDYFSKDLQDLFASQTYLKRGYPFVMNKKGVLVVHPYLPGASIAKTEIYKKITTAINSTKPIKIKYIWPENAFGEKKVMFVQYVSKYELFVGTTYYVKDFNKDLFKLIVFLVISVLVSTITFSVAFSFLITYFKNRIKDLRELLTLLARGTIPNEDSYLIIKDTPEHLLVHNLKKLEDFTESLKKRDYEYHYEKWSKFDKIGENLIKLNSFLAETRKVEIEKQKEQERLLWLNEGLSKFIEILKYQVIEIKDLAYKITSQIVEYINAAEGGFFIVQTDDETGEKYLELLAAYSMHKEKLVRRKIPFGVGFVGRVAIEKQTLYLTEIPETYTKISTALGYAKPKSIAVLPLLFNEEVIGVIELASFSFLSELQLEFLERISENISANLAMWRASQQTAKLLKETREQAKIQQEQQQTLQQHLKELEKLREESEQREIELNSIIKAVDTTALLAEYDVNGYIISANNRFLTTLGLSEAQIIGKHHKQFTSFDVNSQEYRTFWSDLLEGKTKRFIESFNINDETIWLSQNYVPILDKENKVFKILNIAIDITENKILERQLRAQVKEVSKEARAVRKEQRKIRREREEFIAKENAYMAVIKGAEKYVGHVEFSIDGLILYVNDTFAEYLNLDKELLLEKNIKDFINTKELETFKLALETIKKGGEYSNKISFYDSKHELVEIEYTLMAAMNTKNKVEKIIMITFKTQ